MTNTSAIIGLVAETQIHAGSGESNGVVDLPVMREKATGWPCVFGSAVKGSLRARGETLFAANQEIVEQIFGSASTTGSEFAGALLVSDARLVLLPVRSLTGHYRWVTCPDMLSRLARDRVRFGLGQSVAIPQVENNTALVVKGSNRLFLEEYAYACQETDLDALISTLLAPLLGERSPELAEKLAIISNDDFGHICQSAIPVQAHIRINNDTKTVASGALWHEESLPADTVLYFGLTAMDARQGQLPAMALLGQITEGLFGQKPFLQLGGNETTGMGWCSVNISRQGV